VNLGKLTRTQGRGTFVAQYNLEKPIFRLTGFTQDMQMRGMQAQSKILKMGTLKPPDYISRYLKLKEDEPAIIISRLRKAEKVVMAIDTSYIPFNQFSALLHEDLESNSLYGILAKKYSTVPIRSIRSLQAIPCPGPEATLLGISTNAPVLFIVSTNYDQKDLPFEHAESYYRGDRFTFNVEVINQTDKKKPDISLK